MIGHRIELARKCLGFSLLALSDALGGNPSHRAIREFEKGEATPDSDLLLRLSEVLNVSFEFLVSGLVSKLEGMEFRKMASTKVKERAHVEFEVMDRLERYVSIEAVLDLDSSRWQPPFPPVRLAHEAESESVADRLRNAWDLGDDPILDLTELLEGRGLKVLAIPLPGAISGMTCWAVLSNECGRLPVIVVNRNHGLERRRFTLAHELAHRILEVETPIGAERAANRFAGAFLVPASHLRQRVSSERHPGRNKLSYEEIICLKRNYRVSAVAILMRLGQIGVLSESAVQEAFRGFANVWRKREPQPIESDADHLLEMPRRFEFLCHWALAEREISLLRAAMLLRVPMNALETALLGPKEANANHSH